MKDSAHKSEFQVRFTQFFNSCKSRKLTAAEVEKECLPIYWVFLKQEFGGFVKVLLGFVVIWICYNFIPWFSWTVSGIGRLLLVKVLPVWNWEALHRKRCIWDAPVAVRESSVTFKREALDCSFCENFVEIPEITDLTSVEDWPSPFGPLIVPYAKDISMESFEDILFHQIPNHRPCDLRTNLVHNRKASLFDLRKLSRKTSGYFFDFRFCGEDFVKQSRRIDGRPSFFPAHLPPAHTSRLLVSHNYSSSRMLPLDLDGYIFIRQVKGTTGMRLLPRVDCENVCQEQSFLLKEDTGLLFLSDMWDFSYSPASNVNETSVVFITETDWY